MKIIRIFLYVILSMLLTGCQKNVNNGFLIKGKISGYDNNYVYLQYGNFVDSSLVESGSFIFKGKVPGPKRALLLPGPPTSEEMMTVGVVMLENSTINISAKYSTGKTSLGTVKFFDIDSINGSKSQVLRERFEEKMDKTVYNEKNDSIRTVLLFNNLHEFLSANPRSEMSGEYLANLSKYDNLLTGDQIEDLLKIVDTDYQEKGDIESILKSTYKRKMFEIGNMPPAVTLPDQQGMLIDRSTLNGKVVLLEFWASWCVPCRQVNPELVSIYADLKDRGFEIFGISIDRDTDQWRAAVKKDNINWPQVIDTLGTTKKTYSLNSIPFNLLLNREGKIIAQDIKPNELREMLNLEL